MEHRWSGWPGAFCFNCGAGDPGEECLADNCPNATLCVCGVDVCMNPDREHHYIRECPDHPMTECTGKQVQE